jgi:adenylate cyclase
VTNPLEVPSQRSVAIVFGDIVSSSAMVAHYGDLAVTNTFRTFFARIHELQVRHGGTFIKALGDAFLIIFDDVHDALTFASGVQRSLRTDPLVVAPQDPSYPVPNTLRLRLSVHYGPVILTNTVYGNEILGAAVTVAARLTAFAEPGGVVISRWVEELLTPEERRLFRPIERMGDSKHIGLVQFSVLEIPDKDLP